MNAILVKNLSLLALGLVGSCKLLMADEYSSSEGSVRPTVLDYNNKYCGNMDPTQELNLGNIRLARVEDIPLAYDGYNNIEGPVWHNGALYYSNMGSLPPDETGFVLSNQTTIWRWQPGQKPTIWLEDSVAGSNGLALDKEHKLIAARHLDGSIAAIDWQTQHIKTIANGFAGKRFNSPNDLAITFDNRIFFTDPNWNVPSNIDQSQIQGGGEPGDLTPGQRIYHISPEGEVSATKVTQLVPELADKPNGIALSLDQSQLIIGGLRGLWVFDLADNSVINPTKILETPIDGLGKDCQGNIYVTTTRELPRRKDGQVIVVLNKQYKELGAIEVEGIHIVTNVAFGGANRKTLFVTGLTAPMDGDEVRLCGDKACLPAGIYTTELNIPGFPY